MSVAGLKRVLAPFLVITLIFVSLLSTASFVVPVRAQIQFSVWPDKPQYHIGETVILRVEPAPKVGAAFWFVITAPDGSQTRSQELTPGRGWIDVYANKLLGSYRADLWAQVVAPNSTPELVATCSYEIVEVVAGEIKYRGIVEWVRAPDYGVTVTQVLAGGISVGDQTYVTVYGSGQTIGDILVGGQAEVLGECPSCDTPSTQYQVNVHEFWHYIKATGGPTPALTPPNLIVNNPTTDCPSRKVTITGQATPTMPRATITKIHVDWGDRNAEDIPVRNPFSASHTYAGDGTYTITITAYDSNGLSTSRSVSVTVSCATPTTNTPPQLTVSTQVNCRTVTIDGTATPTTPGARITRTHIDWGDRQAEDDGYPKIHATHTYANDGTYTITVTAYDSNRLSTTQTRVISISCAPSGATLPPFPAEKIGSGILQGLARDAATSRFWSSIFLRSYGMLLPISLAGLWQGILVGVLRGYVSWALDGIGVHDTVLKSMVSNLVAVAILALLLPSGIGTGLLIGTLVGTFAIGVLSDIASHDP